MKYISVILFFLSTATIVFGQNNFWTQAKSTIANNRSAQKTFQNLDYKTLELDVSGFTNSLRSVQMRGEPSSKTHTVVIFPTFGGKMEQFSVVETQTLHPDLSKKYPGIKSFAGKGVDNSSATIRFSISNEMGFHGLMMSGKEGMVYIDPLSDDKKKYAIYQRESLSKIDRTFQCSTEDHIKKSTSARSKMMSKTNDKKLRKYRLALSCSAEYGNIFAGTGTDTEKKANILAQMNVTMTRVNGVYERDLSITIELVANNDDIIYFGDTSLDPWDGEWSNKTQETIDAIIGDANYDIGHNFNTTNDGNAGCIGCVCTSGSKGSGYTGRSNPTGDPFDIDYVSHEIGHQFGGYHTQSNTDCRSGSGLTEVEPGSGSTIMGYAGICDTNVQNNSDAYFHYVSIRDISANVQSGASSGCPTIIDLVNKPPTADAGDDFTIPKSTPFVLKGQGSDPDGDVITYTWEQNDPENTNSNEPPSSTWAQGPLFRSREGTTSPNRYMPQLNDVIEGNITPTWEVVPSVARTMEFALTVRDHNLEGGQTADDLMQVTVDGSSGPFIVTEPNTAITWYEGQTQIVIWDVAATDQAPVSLASVNILLSTDGGFTYPITLLSNAPNSGNAEVIVPNNLSSTCRIKVEAMDNIFYDISNVDIEISGAIACNPTVPTGLTSSEIKSTSATIVWDENAGAIFDVQYSLAGADTWVTVSAGGNAKQLIELEPETSYDVKVRSRCTSSSSIYSSVFSFITSKSDIVYCDAQGQDTSDEYIGRVQLNSIDNSSGASNGYADYTSISTDLNPDTDYLITITPTWTGAIYQEGYAVWIDYNQNGSFEDDGEEVWVKSISQETPVSGTFTVPVTALFGSTRMRVALKYEGVPSSCEIFEYGEVEDYSVNILASEAPQGPTDLVAENTIAEITLRWKDNANNEAEFIVERSLGSNTNFIQIGTVPSNVFSYIDMEAEAQTDYTYRVFATNNIGDSEYSNEVTSGLITGLAENILDNSVTIYPNPNYGVFRLRIANGGYSKYKVLLTNVVGKVIHQLSVEKQDENFEYEFDLRNQSKGIYLIQISNDYDRSTHRIIKY